MKTTINEKGLDNLLEEGALCEYCPYIKGSHYPGELCDGTYCNEAKGNYVECNDLEYEEETRSDIPTDVLGKSGEIFER